MMMANRQLDAENRNGLLKADEEFVHVSSSLIKQNAMLVGGATSVRFITCEIIPDVVARFHQPTEKSSDEKPSWQARLTQAVGPLLREAARSAGRTCLEIGRRCLSF